MERAEKQKQIGYYFEEFFSIFLLIEFHSQSIFHKNLLTLSSFPAPIFDRQSRDSRVALVQQQLYNVNISLLIYRGSMTVIYMCHVRLSTFHWLARIGRP